MLMRGVKLQKEVDLSDTDRQFARKSMKLPYVNLSAPPPKIKALVLYKAKNMG